MSKIPFIKITTILACLKLLVMIDAYKSWVIFINVQKGLRYEYIFEMKLFLLPVSHSRLNNFLIYLRLVIIKLG